MIQYILITTLYNKSPHKHLGMHPDAKLVDKTIGLLCKLQAVLPRPFLVTVYKVFIRPHLDYGDIIYGQAYKEPFHQKLESIQYNAALAITGAITGTSREKLYRELGLESLQKRR